MQIFSRPIGMLETNCYIIKGPEGCIMIDPGDGDRALEAFIDDVGADIKYIILTHGHFDHIMGIPFVVQKTGAKIAITKEDEAYLSDRELSMIPAYSSYKPQKADLILESGKMSLCGMDFEVIKTPGHTQGGCALYFENEKTLISGDTLFTHGYGRTDFIGGSMKQLAASLRRLLAMPGDITVYPGHYESALLSEIKKGYSL